ncbi:hypothetical protein SOM70_20100 [Streptomyces salinarius]|uniref:hypothetical protein n=1 Tax=Streptomyces TaxID=1883 RepID=UPI0013E0A165|nr:MULTISPECIES: hypothetical protein [unclassified Streptomyces]QKW59017.1 hypothetical protein HUT15_34790 [Streptomyces sp. NA03103]
MVDIDYGVDAAGGVFLAWKASPRLQACASHAFRLKQLDEPALRHSSAVEAAMMHAMAQVLASAGRASWPLRRGTATPAPSRTTWPVSGWGGTVALFGDLESCEASGVHEREARSRWAIVPGECQVSRARNAWARGSP